MRKFFLAIIILCLSLTSALVGCSGGNNSESSPSNPSRGTLEIADVYVSVGGSAQINPKFSYEEEALTYSFEGDLIAITDNTISGLKLGEVTVTATSENYQVSFKVYVVKSTFKIENLKVETGYFAILDVEFDKVEHAEELTYTMANGDQLISGIAIENGLVSATCKDGSYQIKASSSCASYEFTLTVSKSAALSIYASTLNKRLAEMQNAVEIQDSTLFVGDSFFDPTYFGEYFQNNFNGLNAHMLGINSTRAENWYWLAQKVKVIPKNLVVNLGSNDIFDLANATAQASDIRSMLEMFHYLMPQTQIYWVTVQQRIFDDHDQSGIARNEQVSKINNEITAWAQGKDWLKVADATTAISADIENCLIADGVHPSELGYDKIFNALEETGMVINEYQNLQLQISNIDTIYPGYYAKIKAVVGKLDGAIYTYNQDVLKIEDGKVYALPNASIGTYTVNYVDANGNENSFKVNVKDANFLTTKPGGIGNDFALRFNETLQTLASNEYKEGELVLFAGDSFMDERYFFTDFYSRFSGKNAHILGIGASQAAQWIWYGQKFFEYSPKAVVFNVGTNDIFDAGKSADEVIAILKQLFEEYHENMPTTTIYWYTIIPRIGATDASGNVKSSAVNAYFKEYASSRDWLVYLDSHSAFSADTSLYKPNDTVHPACPKGYDVLMDILTKAGFNVSDKPEPTVIKFADKHTVNGTDTFATSSIVNRKSGYLFKCNFTVSACSSNAHVTLHFNGSADMRFLLWDDDNNGTLRYTIAYLASKDAFNTSGADKTIELAVLVNEKNAYLFIDGVLRCAYLEVGNIHSFSYGTENMSASFTDIYVYDNSESEAQKFISKVSNYENGSYASNTKIVDIALG